MIRRPRVPFIAPAARSALAILVAVLCFGTLAASAPRSTADLTPGKLPKTVIPLHYAIDLELNPESRKIDGFEVIDIEVREPTARIVLNADSIRVTRATIDKKPRSASIAHDDDAETVTLTFPSPLSAGRHKLRLTFAAQIHKSGPGLYTVDYPTEAGSKRLISSHFAPADARRAFPVWDEPVLKATFALTVTVPRSFMAVSNMPVAHEEPAGPAAKKIAFLPTPKMSSYLLTLTAGELERISGEVDGIAVSVVTLPGKIEQGRFALTSAIDVLRYFNDYFGFKYPLPKLDLVAVPQGYVSAMEHWGAITFRENKLLIDRTTSPAAARRDIFALIVHEIAHQWFGNLVTMTWWDNLWLNEGFATWMESKATEQFHPRWRTWLNNNDEKQSAMRQDATGTAHPVHQPVRDKSAASDMFDDITYNKAGAIVRMLEGYLGKDIFREGIRRYIAENAYGNTIPADLWRALEAASGKPVAAIASTFIEQRGVPLVVAQSKCVDNEQHIVLRQEPFAVNGATTAPGRWQIPIAIGLIERQRPVKLVVLKNGPMEIVAGRCGEPVKLNFGDTGYYRVQYDEAMRSALTRAFARLSPADRVNMLADTWALIEAGRAGPESYLELIEELGDNSRPVWEQVMRVLKDIDRLQYGRSERAAFQAYARAKLRPVLDRLTWDDEPRPDSDGTGILRARLVQTLGAFGDEEVLSEAKDRFAVLLENPTSLRPGLRYAVIRLAGMAADRATYDTLLALARKATTASERERYYMAAASARDPALARESLNLALTGQIPAKLIGSVLNAVASEGGHADLAWDFLRKNYRTLAERRGSSFGESFFADFMKNFSDKTHAAELAGLAAAHGDGSSREAARQAQGDVRFNADFKARALPAIDAWVRRHTGAQD